MKFGLHYRVPCSASQSPVQRYRDTLEQAAHAEALGFESVWLVEQHFIPELSDHTGADDPFWRRSPNEPRCSGWGLRSYYCRFRTLRIAEEVATLDVLCKGRVEFDIGRVLRQYRRYRTDLGEQFISNKFVLHLDLPGLSRQAARCASLLIGLSVHVSSNPWRGGDCENTAAAHKKRKR